MGARADYYSSHHQHAHGHKTIGNHLEVILTSASVDEILWCDHSNETSSAVVSHGNIYIKVIYKMKFGICLEF